MATDLDLSKEIGPLPLGAWIAVVAGGLGLAYFINRNQEAEASATGQISDSGVGAGGGQYAYDPPQSVDEEEVEETNESWAREVANWLIAQGHNPGIASNAVNKYIVGENLNVREQALINLVLPRFGVPPDPLPPVAVPEVPDNGDGDGNGDGSGIRWADNVPAAIRNSVSLQEMYRAKERLTGRDGRGFVGYNDMQNMARRVKMWNFGVFDSGDARELVYRTLHSEYAFDVPNRVRKAVSDKKMAAAMQKRGHNYQTRINYADDIKRFARKLKINFGGRIDAQDARKIVRKA